MVLDMNYCQIEALESVEAPNVFTDFIRGFIDGFCAAR